MRTRKLTYIFHNPNTEEATSNFLITLFTEVNQPKLEAAIRRIQELTYRQYIRAPTVPAIGGRRGKARRNHWFHQMEPVVFIVL